MTIFQTLMRPVEINYGADAATDTNPSIRHVSAGFSKDIYVGDGVYGSVAELVGAINDAIVTEASITSRFVWTRLTADTTKLCLQFISHAYTCQLVFYDANLARLLGYTGHAYPDVPIISSAHNADYPPLATFCSPYQLSSYDRWWGLDRFKGAKASNGAISGFTLGPQLYGRTFKWSANQYTHIDQETATYTFASATYYPASERSWEAFAHDCMETAPVSSAANGTPMKGLYYIDSGESLVGDPGSVTTITGSGGIRYELGSSPDYYTFCTPELGGLKTPKNFLPVGRRLHDIEIEVTTATAPTWTHGTTVCEDTPA